MLLHRSCTVPARCRPCRASCRVAFTVVRPHHAELPRRAARCIARAKTSSSSALRAELQVMEAEREATVAAAESSAKTATKLVEMSRLLEALALEKVRQGDEDGARKALAEKKSVTETLQKTSEKADINYKLAAALASCISAKQRTLLSEERGSNGSSSSSSYYSSAPPQPSPPSSSYSSSSSPSYTGWTSSADSPPASPGGPSSSFYGDAGQQQQQQLQGSGASPQWKLQQSLEEARQRLKFQEQEAAREGRMAKLSAEESILQAKERIAREAASSVLEAQQRLRATSASSQGSMEAAQARLRARDEEVLLYVRRIMERYKRGAYVSEDELEFAFRQLEQRFTL